MPQQAFTPQRPLRSPIKYTTTEWHLHYISSWSLAQYAPNARGLPTTLAYDSHTGAFLVCSYQLPQKFWKLLCILDPMTVHAYISDNRTRVRVLGWKDPNSRVELSVYWDLQFVKEAELAKFLDVLDRDSDIVLKSTEPAESTMIRVFRQVPGKAAVMAQNSLIERELEPYRPPTTRDYQPQYARFGDSSVAMTPWKPETGDLFDGYTQKREEAREREGDPPLEGCVPEASCSGARSSFYSRVFPSRSQDR